jgi:hypothetical protein
LTKENAETFKLQKIIKKSKNVVNKEIFPPPKRRSRKLLVKPKVYEVTSPVKSPGKLIKGDKYIPKSFRTTFLMDKKNQLSYTKNDYENYKSELNKLFEMREKVVNLKDFLKYFPPKFRTKLSNQRKWSWEKDYSLEDIQNRRKQISKRFMTKFKDINQMLKAKFDSKYLSKNIQKKSKMSQMSKSLNPSKKRTRNNRRTRQKSEDRTLMNRSVDTKALEPIVTNQEIWLVRKGTKLNGEGGERVKLGVGKIGLARPNERKAWNMVMGNRLGDPKRVKERYLHVEIDKGRRLVVDVSEYDQQKEAGD